MKSILEHNTTVINQEARIPMTINKMRVENSNSVSNSFTGDAFLHIHN